MKWISSFSVKPKSWCILTSAGWPFRGHRGRRTSGSGAGWTSCISLQRLLSPDGPGQGNSPQKGWKLILQRNLLWLDLHEESPQLTNRICLSGRRLVLPKVGQDASAGFNMEIWLWAELLGHVRGEGEVLGRERERERRFISWPG